MFQIIQQRGMSGQDFEMDDDNLVIQGYPNCTPLPLHGARTSTSRRRKGASDYAAEYPDDLTHTSIKVQGNYVDTIVCKFCSIVVGARSDRIKEHLLSKRHKKLKTKMLEFTGAKNGNHSSHSHANSPNTAATTPFKSSGTGERTSISDNSVNFGDQFLGNNWQQVATKPQSMPSLLPISNCDLKQANKSADKRISRSRSMENFSRSTVIRSGAHNSPTLPSKNLNRSIHPSQRKVNCRWNDHAESLINGFKIGDAYTDVTLSAENKFVKCHKIILCAGSDYFKEMLDQFAKHNHQKHCVMIFINIKFEHLQLVLEYIYTGEVSVPENKMKSFLNTAKELCVRGLKHLQNQVNRGNVSIQFARSSNADTTNFNQNVTSMSAEEENPQVSTSALTNHHGKTIGRKRNASGISLPAFTNESEGTKHDAKFSRNVSPPQVLYASDFVKRHWMDDVPKKNLRTYSSSNSSNQGFPNKKRENSFSELSVKKRTLSTSATFPVYNSTVLDGDGHVTRTRIANKLAGSYVPF